MSEETTSKDGKAKQRLRRSPQQARSRSRVEDILNSAFDLVAEKGLAALTMREIAHRSGMPLASVYQYFPNKSAVIETLYQRYAEETRQFVSEAVAAVDSFPAIMAAASRITDLYYERLHETPGIQDLLNATQADKALHNIDISETRAQADVFTSATEAFIPEDARLEYARIVYLLFQLAGGTMRLALMMDDEEEGLQIVTDYKRLIDAQLKSLAG